MKHRFKKVIVRKTRQGVELCHTLGGTLNPFKDFSDEQAARNFAEENGLSCAKEVFEGDLSDYNR